MNPMGARVAEFCRGRPMASYSESRTMVKQERLECASGLLEFAGGGYPRGVAAYWPGFLTPPQCEPRRRGTGCRNKVAARLLALRGRRVSGYLSEKNYPA